MKVNSMATCLEYIGLDMKLVMCFSDGHNAIWTSWDFLQIPTWPKPKTKNFLLWITSNRLCLHVGLEFWTIFSFTCSESTSFTTCKIRFYTLYLWTNVCSPVYTVSYSKYVVPKVLFKSFNSNYMQEERKWAKTEQYLEENQRAETDKADHPEICQTNTG